MFICCKYFKAVLLTMQTITSVCGRIRNSSSTWLCTDCSAVPCRAVVPTSPAVQRQERQRAKAASPATLWYSKTWVRCSWSAAAAASFCWCPKQQAVLKGWKFLGSLVQQFHYQNKEPLPRKYREPVYQFLLTWKYNVHFPLLSEERFWQHALNLHASSNRIYCVILFIYFFHVVVFTAKLANCNWNVKDPASNRFLLLV